MGRGGGCQEWDNCYNLKLIYLLLLTFNLATVGSFLSQKLTALQTLCNTPPLFSLQIKLVWWLLCSIDHSGATPYLWLSQLLCWKRIFEAWRRGRQSVGSKFDAAAVCTICLCTRKFLLSTSINSCKKNFASLIIQQKAKKDNLEARACTGRDQNTGF